MKIPVFDLNQARDRIQPQLEKRWQGILERNAYVLGPEVGEFENSFASFLGAAGCVAVGNGTDALTLALRALEIQPGDEVLLPGFTFFATYESVVLAGAVPVLVDICAETFNLDLEAAEGLVTDKTVGLVGVHLYGRPVNAEAVDHFCKQHGLWWVEDAAQAHGAKWGSKRAGTLGCLAAWSFYPSKNLGCFGDGGAVTGNDVDLLARVRRLANHGQVGRYDHHDVGTNSRMDSFQAAVLNCRLPGLDHDNACRANLVARYREALSGVAGVVLTAAEPSESHSAHHLMTIRCSRRDELQAFLTSAGIGSSVHYPKAVHDQVAASKLHEEAHLPESRKAASEVLSLPLYPEMEEEAVTAVCEAIVRFYRS